MNLYTINVNILVYEITYFFAPPIPQRRLKLDEIGKYMSSPVLCLGTECTVSEAILFFHTQRVEALFVEELDRYVGMVIKSDLIQSINQGEIHPEITMIGERMDQPIPCLDCHCSPKEAHDFMCNHQIRYVAVTEERHIVGILSMQDLLAPSENRKPKLD